MAATIALVLNGYKDNSGAAPGTDTSGEFACKLIYDEMVKRFNLNRVGYSEVINIALPWQGFNGRYSCDKDGYYLPFTPEAELIAMKHYSGWNYANSPVRSLMVRNCNQVLGMDLKHKAKFVFCLTEDGCNDGDKTTGKTGGTGQAIRVAKAYGVPVFNMNNDLDFNRFNSWLENEKKRIIQEYGIDIDLLVEGATARYTPFENTVKGDIFEFMESGGADVLIHGANCFKKMGSGIANIIRLNYFDAYEADLKTIAGDRKKLGTFTSASFIRNNHSFDIVNAYTQFNYGRDNKLYTDYEAIRKVMGKINTHYSGKRIAFSKIGANLSNGCWVTVADIIKNELKNVNPIFVDNGQAPEPRREYNQITFDM